MVEIVLQGGLGNQMHQFAFGLAQSKILKAKLTLNTALLGKSAKLGVTFRDFELECFPLIKFQINNRQISLRNRDEFLYRGLKRGFIGDFFRFINNLSDVNIIQENSTSPFSFINFSNRRNVFIGYWQSSKYFENISEEIYDYFKQPKEFVDLKQEFSFSDLGESINVHVRRADYLTNIKARNFHGPLSLEYYFDSIEILRDKNYSNMPVVFFSDDPIWCQNAFKTLKNAFYVIPTKVVPVINYLHALSNSRNLILSNSSFSWWAAWLAGYREKNRINVVVPNRWFLNQGIDDSNIIEDHWIKSTIR